MLLTGSSTRTSSDRVLKLFHSSFRACRSQHHGGVVHVGAHLLTDEQIGEDASVEFQYVTNLLVSINRFPERQVRGFDCLDPKGTGQMRSPHSKVCLTAMTKSNESITPLETLLKRIKRQFISECARPPNAAASSLGRELAKEFLTAAVEEPILEALCQPNLHCSIPPAFFDVIVEHAEQTRSSNGSDNEIFDWSWLTRWVISFEQLARETNRLQPSAVAGLEASLTAYAKALICVPGLDKYVLNTFSQLQWASSKRTFVREIAGAIFCSQETDDFIYRRLEILTPLVAASVLSLPNTEQRAYLAQIWRAVWKTWSHKFSEQKEDICLVGIQLHWFVRALLLYMKALPMDVDSVQSQAGIELAESWFLEIIALAQVALDYKSYHDIRQLQYLIDQQLVRQVMPMLLSLKCGGVLSAVVTMHKSWTVLLESLLQLLDSTTAASGQMCEMDTLFAYKFCLLVMSTPVSKNRQALLNLLVYFVPKTHSAFVLLQAILSIYRHDPMCCDVATSLEDMFTRDKQRFVDLGPSTLLPIEAFQKGEYEDESEIIERLAQHSIDGNWTPWQQLCMLLVGILLISHSQYSDKGYEFLKSLMARYHDLCVFLLPIIVERIQRASADADGETLMRDMEFVCSSLTVESSSAQEVWNLLQQWSQPNISIAIRIMVIRLYPKLVAGNSRLYRRVIDQLGVTLEDREPEVRLAVAATLADMAKDGTLKDVSDAIGWIQGLLTEVRESPVKKLIVHYAIMALHYLVVDDELDFEVVFKVLQKKLCPVSDLEAITKLPLVITEALVTLLGDGECGVKDESDEEGEISPEVQMVSTQTKKAVSTLTKLGLVYAGIETGTLGNVDSELVTKIRFAIVKSLSKYSLRALGVNEESINAHLASCEEGCDKTEALRLAEDGRLYSSVCEMLISCLDLPVEDAENDPVLALAGRILEEEEDIVGSSLWVKRREKREKVLKDIKARVSELRAALPPIEDVKLYVQGKGAAAAAIAILLTSDGTQLTVLRDNIDAAIESNDPLVLVFAVHACLRIARMLVSSGSKVGLMLAEIGGWFEIFVSPDAMYMILASISMFLPPDLKEESSESTYVEEIHEVVVRAFRSSLFQKSDMSKICISLIAISEIRRRHIDGVFEIVDLIEKSVRGYGGQQTFGAFYGIAMIANFVPQVIEQERFSTLKPELRSLIMRITSFLVEELLSCFEDAGPVTSDLVACIKNGHAGSSLVDSVAQLGSNSISLLMTKHVMARSLFISCALGLPALHVVNGELLVACFRLLESFEWGSGKGIAIPSTFRTCQIAELLKEEELKLIYVEYASVFGRRVETADTEIDSEGLDDLFYAVSGTSPKPTSHVVKSMLVGNSQLFDDDGCALSLVATALGIASLPSLGIGEFDSCARLRSKVAVVDIDSVLEIVERAVEVNDDSKYCSLGTILMGYFSSLDITKELQRDIEVEQSLLGTGENMPQQTNAIEFDPLPTGAAGTMLARLLEALEKCLSSNRSEVFVRVLGSLSCISVPGVFANGFLVKMLESKRHAWSCISFLASQTKGRRRVYVDGQDFIKLSLKICTLDSYRWLQLVGEENSRISFVRSFVETIAKIPTDKFELALIGVCEKCAVGFIENPCFFPFMTTLRKLLTSTALSPKARLFVRNVVCHKLLEYLDAKDFNVVAGGSRHSSDKSALEEYCCCLSEIPLEYLDSIDFFKLRDPRDLGSGEYLMRPSVLLALLDSEYFGSPRRELNELANMTSWIAKRMYVATQATDSEDHVKLHRILCLYAKATRKEHASAKRERISAIFEILMLTKVACSRIGLEWLALVVQFWTRGKEGTTSSLEVNIPIDLRAESTSNDTMKVIVGNAMLDLPRNLATFSHEEKYSATVSNHLFRLLKRWTEHGAEQEILHCLEQTMITCRSSLTNDDAFLAFAVSQLKETTLLDETSKKIEK